MSWLVDLAGKAESLLEKVDQTAANALQVDKGAGSEPTSTNTRTAPSPAYVPGIEKSHERNSDNTTAAKGFSKTNVNVSNSKYGIYTYRHDYIYQSQVNKGGGLGERQI